MAVILGNPFGELRGKLGGSVFSRNGSMAYVKQYVVPVNPNSLAQQNARAGMTIASKTWSTKSGAVKAHFNEYAKYKFLPRVGSHSNKYSGYQAWISLCCAAHGGYNNERQQYYQFNNGDYDFDICYSTFSYDFTNPPLFAKTTDMVAVNGTAYPMELFSIEMDEQGVIKFRIKLVGCADTETFDLMQDSGGNNNGFVVYASNPVTGHNMFYESPLRYCMGYWAPMNGCGQTSPYPAFNDFEFYSVNWFDVTKFVSFPMNGDIVRMTVYSIDNFGQLCRLGSKDITVADVNGF